MTPNEPYREKCHAFRDKCKQHLKRADLARRLALTQIRSGGTVISDNKKLVDEALGDADSNRLVAIEAVIAKTHFLLLKVEFEFFLKRIIYSLWDQYFEALLQQRKVRGLSGKHTLKEFARAVACGQAKEFVLHRLIPHHGLDAFEKVLNDSTAISLPALFKGKDQNCWCQIRSAFEVRHLIEHANGMVDERFRSNVVPEKAWQKSSWGDLTLQVRDKIPIREEDFQATFAAMDRATDVVAGRLATFAP